MNEPRVALDARRHNNFGILRLSFALLVLFSHSYPLATGSEAAEPLMVMTGGQLGFGGLAVDGFFLISGFLITESWVRSRSASVFAVKRLLRIYPGYFAAFAFSLAIGFAGSTPHNQYIKNLFYDNSDVIDSILFLNYGGLDKPPAFDTNPHPKAVNGSLWTLQPELKCYALTFILGVFGLTGGKRATVIILSICAADYAVNIIYLKKVDTNLVRFFTIFFLGAAIASEAIPRPRLTPLRIIIVFAIIIAMIQHRIAFALLYPAVFALLLFGITFARFTPGAALFSRYDLSYGIYLYAFPIQQTLVRFLGIREPAMLFLAALPITVLLAFASWQFVERPALTYAAILTKRS